MSYSAIEHILIYNSYNGWFTVCSVPTLENLEFCRLLFQAWNLLKKWVNLGSLTEKPGKKLYISKFCVSRFTFQGVIYPKNHLNTYFLCLHYQHTHWFKAKLTWNFIALTWKIHWILSHQRSGNPMFWSVGKHWPWKWLKSFWKRANTWYMVARLKPHYNRLGIPCEQN